MKRTTNSIHIRVVYNKRSDYTEGKVVCNRRKSLTRKWKNTELNKIETENRKLTLNPNKKKRWKKNLILSHTEMN